MRKLKFRAWVEWIGKPCFEYSENNYPDTFWNVYYDGNNVEQYTGLKDENGKEIYEGDVVALVTDIEELEIEDCRVITFSNGCFRVGEGVENYAGKYLSDWTIVGNVHENPELIGGKQ